MSVLQGSPSYRKSKKVTEEWRRPTLPAQNFSGKSPDLPLILENFRRGLSRKELIALYRILSKFAKFLGE